MDFELTSEILPLTANKSPSPLQPRQKQILKIVDPETNAVINENDFRENQPSCSSFTTSYYYPLFSLDQAVETTMPLETNSSSLLSSSFLALPSAASPLLSPPPTPPSSPPPSSPSSPPPSTSVIRYSAFFLKSLSQTSASLQKPKYISKFPGITRYPRKQLKELHYAENITRSPRVFCPLQQKLHPSNLKHAHGLARCENPWSDRRVSVCNQPTAIKAFKGILNRITPTTFSYLLSKCLTLKIRTVEDFKSFAKTLYTSAVCGPMYAPLYAKLCYRISQKYSLHYYEGERVVTFRDLIVDICEMEDRAMLMTKSAKESLALRVTDVKRELLQIDLRDLRQKAKGRFRFVGELFNIGMIDPNSIHLCAASILNSDSSDKYECLAVLLETSGRQLDIPTDKNLIERYFHQIEYMMKNCKSWPLRVRMLLQDLVELKENNWVLVRRKEVPKTLHDIYKEYKMEELELYVQLRKFRKRKHKDSCGSNNRDSISIAKASCARTADSCNVKDSGNNSSYGNAATDSKRECVEAGRKSSRNDHSITGSGSECEGRVDTNNSMDDFSQPPNKSRESNLEDVFAKIFRVVQNFNHVDNRKIVDYIQRNTSQEKRKQPSFICQLTKTLVSACLVEELNMEKLRWRAEILTDYMDSHTKEEHALIALEELVEDSTLSNSRDSLREIKELLLCEVSSETDS